MGKIMQTSGDHFLDMMKLAFSALQEEGGMMEDTIYRVFGENSSVYADFTDEEEAVKFRDEEYHGAIVVIKDGKEIGHF